ncbi:MAG: ribonuclease III [Chloroflexi bacterium]|nr:ribonuclease III [Chloroflexota bacterium]
MATRTLEDALGVRFHDRAVLQEALSHSSYANEHPQEGKANERLEFLGDALLGLVVAQELYRRLPDLDEGSLTDLRSQVVRGETLATVARRMGLGQHLLLGQGEAASGGRDRDSNLAGVLEAVAGAALVDRGYGEARRFVLRALAPELRRAGRAGVPQDPKSRLQETLQRRGTGAPRYEVLRTEGSGHRPEFRVQAVVDGRVLGTGRGRRKVDAERQAAREALAALAQHPER